MEPEQLFSAFSTGHTMDCGFTSEPQLKTSLSLLIAANQIAPTAFVLTPHCIASSISGGVLVILGPTPQRESGDIRALNPTKSHALNHNFLLCCEHYTKA